MKKIYTILLLFAVSSSMVVAQSSHTKKADKLYDQLRYVDAATAYMDALKKGDNSTYVYERLANSYYYVNDTKNAETYYARAIGKSDVEAETVYRYAQTLKSNGKFSEYNNQMKAFAKLQPNDSRAIAFMKDPDYLPKITDERNQKFQATNLDQLNSKYSDFGGRIYGNEFYFTSARNTSGKTYDWNDEPFLDIYKASAVGGTIKDATALKGDVNTKYHESTVAITADGKKMYFDRNDYYKGKYHKGKDGVSQLQIFTAENVDGQWKNIQPVSFNMKDYSTGHPALSPDGKTLYFVSDRPGGKGDSDIYRVAINEDGSFGEPENLAGINTEGKEVFPFVDEKGVLYFSSDGHPGMGGLDVFSAEPRGNSFGNVKNLGLGVNSPQDDFAYYFDVSKGEGYVSSNRSGGKGSDDIYKIEPVCELIVKVTVIDEDTNLALSGVHLELLDNRENRLKTYTTGNDGKQDVSVACDQAHVIQAIKDGYESKKENIASSKAGEKSLTIKLRPIDRIVEGDKVKLDAIHFDFDKHNIKPQAAFELDKLVDLMKKNPEMKVRVEGHTDNRGSKSYNQKLSERRAKSTVEYVVSKGISRDRISGKGFGKSRPVYDCGSKCSEEQHAANRRSEFIIEK